MRDKRTLSARTYPPRMRDVATIDSELRLLLAIRRLVREEEGRTPGTRRIDQLPDERVVETTRCSGQSPLQPFKTLWARRTFETRRPRKIGPVVR